MKVTNVDNLPLRPSMAVRVAPLVTGLFAAAALVWVVRMSVRNRRRAVSGGYAGAESPRVTADEGPLDLWEVREPDEVPTDRGRLMPYELGRTPNKRSTTQYRRRWSIGSSGGFGSGGIGRTG
ncbi:hypothetical protein H1D24_17370 [Streptomyces sp. PSKA28]|uniref:Secreted protein n=1 Tax=Streptomyces himalayensis subsp. himalayensis TaxID=2756131 RepID=A0A7W0DLZ0_9ACTN|nr:hypothetical protein [Streptomyces himalayensis subsp. himalayensis]